MERVEGWIRRKDGRCFKPQRMDRLGVIIFWGRAWGLFVDCGADRGD